MAFGRFFILLAAFIYVTNSIHAQDSVWSLQRCLEYAEKNNLSIHSGIINERIASIQLEASKMAVLPNISVSSSYGKSLGRSINPTSNEFENNTYSYGGLSGSSSVLLFNWLQNWKTIKKNKFQNEASVADKEQTEWDVALSVAEAYLNILLAGEQIELNKEQLKVSNKNVEKTAALNREGKSNGLDVAKIKTQLMNDSASYLNSLLAYNQAVIILKAILNLDFKTGFEPVAVDTIIPVGYIRSLNPEEIFNTASGKQPSIRSNQLKVEIAKADLAINKSKLYPSVNLGYSFGSNYSSTFYEYLPNGEARLMNWGKQLRNNTSHSIYLSLSIPVFNGFSSRYAIKQSKFSVAQSEIKQKQDLLQLKQNIYQAWNNVLTALQVYTASKAASESSTVEYSFAEQRYDMGLISASDLVLAQRDKNTAAIDELSKKYDLLFKVKIIEYYQNPATVK